MSKRTLRPVIGRRALRRRKRKLHRRLDKLLRREFFNWQSPYRDDWKLDFSIARQVARAGEEYGRICDKIPGLGT